MKPAYLIGHLTVLDAEKWAEYRSKVALTLTPWCGELIFRGKQLEILGGRHQHSDTVVIRFPNNEALKSWFHSDAYQALIPIREQAADMDLISYEADS